MTTKLYLEKVLEEHSLTTDSPEMENIRKEREKVEKILHEYFKDSEIIIKYGGSKCKNTMIRESYDLDIICFFQYDETAAGTTLKELFENTQKALQPHYFVFPKTSALRLAKFENNTTYYYHIDVVPGRYVDDKKDDAYLHQNNGEKDYLKTNLEKQISHIKDSGLERVIKLIKYWKVRNSLQIKTFVLELLIVKILKDCDEGNLEECLTTFWNEIIDNCDELSVEDPANPNGNDLSPLFDSVVKSSLKSASENAMYFVNSENWEDVFGPVKKEEDKDSKIKIIETIAATTPVVSKPWAE